MEGKQMNIMATAVRLLEIPQSSALIIGLFLGTLFSSCNTKKQSFLLPNGEKVEVLTISQLEENYRIEYQQYLGFTSKYDDTFLKEVLFLPQNDEKIGQDVLEDTQIAELKSKKLKLIKFNYVLRDNSVGRKSFEEYILRKYRNLTQVKVDSSFFKLIDARGNNMCDVKYFDFSVPGYWLTIYPN